MTEQNNTNNGKKNRVVGDKKKNYYWISFSLIFLSSDTKKETEKIF